MFALLLAAGGAYAQDAHSEDFLITPAPSEPPEFLLVLETAQRTFIIDPEVQDMVAFESAVDVSSVEAIEMISGEEGITRFGLKGRNGVIIIQFKPDYTLPSALTDAVTDGE